MRDNLKREEINLTLQHHVPLRQLQTGDVGHFMFQTEANIVWEQGVHLFSMVYALLGACRGARIADAEISQVASVSERLARVHRGALGEAGGQECPRRGRVLLEKLWTHVGRGR